MIIKIIFINLQIPKYYKTDSNYFFSKCEMRKTRRRIYKKKIHLTAIARNET